MDRPEERLKRAQTELAAGRPVVRAVIVKAWGSTPREVGADMVFSTKGDLWGTVGGGCGEAEVYELAQELLADPDGSEGALLHVDLTENPADGGDKVCGGRFDVLLHRLAPECHRQTLAESREALDRGLPIRWSTDIGRQGPGFWKSNPVLRLDVSPSLSLTLDPSVDEPGWEVGADGRQVFSESFGHVLRLVIVGAGHIARPLCRLAADVGYGVSVLDDRSDYAQDHFFPDAEQVVAGDYASELLRLAAGPLTSVVLVTRGHKHDQDCLRLLVETPLQYLGMIGSQRRIDAVFAELREEGVPLEVLRGVQAPLGLDIGARTPAEIAVSIVAQMIKFRREGSAGGRAANDRKRHQRIL